MAWTISKLETLIRDEVEEHLELEYKRAAALGKTDKVKNEISKDVSAFANSAGGTLIYGIAEGTDSRKHLPETIDWVTEPEITKEWLENVIISRIQPRIPGLQISAVRSETGSVFVVEVPQSMTVHQASDKKYYKRHNFSSVPMEDYEVRDVMNRHLKPVVEVEPLIITSPFLWEGETRLFKTLTRIPALAALNGHYFETKNILRLRVVNSGLIRANNVRVDISFPPGVLYDGRKALKRLENTITDPLDTGGFAGSTANGFKRYSSVFPGGDFEFQTSFDLNKDLSVLLDKEIDFVVYADDATPRKLTICMGNLRYQKRPRSRFGCRNRLVRR